MKADKKPTSKRKGGGAAPPAVISESDRRIVKNSLWMMLQPLSLNLVSILVAGYMARALGEVSFGYFALAFAYADLASYLTSMGLSSVTIRDIARDPSVAADSIARVTALRLALSLVLALAVALLGLLGEMPWPAKVAMLLAAVTIPLRSWLRTLADAFSGFEEQKISARCEMVGGLILTVSSVLALALYPGVIALSFAYVAGPLCSLALLWLALSRRHFTPTVRVDRAFFTKKFREGLPFFGIGILSTMMNRADAVLVSALYGPAVVGVYVAVTYQVVQRLRIVPESLAGALYPALARASSDEERVRLLGRYLRYALAATAPIATGACLVGGDLVALLFGEGFRKGGDILAAAAFSIPLWAVIHLAGMTLAAMGRESEALKRRAITAAVFAALSLALVPDLAGLGSALAITGALAVEAVILLAGLRSTAPGFVGEIMLGRILAANLTMALLVFAASGLPVFLQVGLGALAYAVATVAAGLVPLGELRLLLSRGPKVAISKA
jgi:O-antigen/teichoic acid export membrane protein